MFYKISNTANRISVEDTLSAKFKFPNMYKPKKLIDGTVESVLPIITSEHKNQLQFAIWGMLPEYFKGDWQPYQHINNTLNIETETLKKYLMFHRNSQMRRCLIPITGYVDFDKTQGEITPYLINHTNTTPFCVAGIYNQLEDGFFTFSLITKEYENRPLTTISKHQPAILHRDYHKNWLNAEVDTLHALEFLKHPHDYSLSRLPTSNSFVWNRFLEDDSEILI